MRLILTVILSVAVSLLAVSLYMGRSANTEKETPYERVLRTGVLKCGYSVWPPYYTQDPNTKELGGMMKEMVDAVGGILDWKIEYVESYFGHQVTDLESGKIDAYCFDAPLVYRTMKYIDYVTPFFFIPVYVYGRENETRFQSLQDMNDPAVTFVGLDGDASVTIAQEKFPKAKTDARPSSTDPTMLMNDVALGKADLMVLESFSAEGYNEANPEKRLGRLDDGSLLLYPLMMSVKKGDDRLVNTLDTAVSFLQTRGTFDDLIRKYDPKGIHLVPAAPAYRSSQSVDKKP